MVSAWINPDTCFSSRRLDFASYFRTLAQAEQMAQRERHVAQIGGRAAGAGAAATQAAAQNAPTTPGAAAPNTPANDSILNSSVSAKVGEGVFKASQSLGSHLQFSFFKSFGRSQPNTPQKNSPAVRRGSIVSWVGSILCRVREVLMCLLVCFTADARQRSTGSGKCPCGIAGTAHPELGASHDPAPCVSYWH